MTSDYIEECVMCLKTLVFQTEKDRLKAMNAYIGEIMCESCLTEAMENA